MLSCPFCQFENNDSTRFCEQCSQPLQRWHAVQLPHRVGSSPLSDQAAAPDGYLDAQGRYRWLSPPDQTASPLATEGGTVIDCQPTATSPLKALQAAWLANPDLDPASLETAMPVPVEALPYLALQADYFPAIPELHDLCQAGQHTVLLLEDRIRWPSFLATWPATDPLQQAQWLFEISSLWAALAPWQVQSTLLKPQRLRLNENGLLCLTQLDADGDRSPLSLQTLGQTWQQTLLAEPAATASALGAVILALTQGAITEVEQLQNDLIAVAQRCRSGVATPQPSARPQPTTSTLERPLPHSRLQGSLTQPQMAAEALANDPAAALTGEDALTLTDEELIRLTVAQGDLAEADDSTGPLELPTMALPMKLLQIADAGQSHVGQQRNHNEDWFFTQSEWLKANGPRGTAVNFKGLYILCDGMGGHASGEVASQLAVQTLRDYFAQHWIDSLPDQKTLHQAVINANQAIFNINQANATSGVGRMGTTLVVVLIHNLDLVVVHVGDSRLYSYSKGLGLRQLTLDHEVGQREINRGVEPAIAYARPDAYQLTQAIGPRSEDDLSPSIGYHEVAEDTLFILCSDGLSDNDLLERYGASHVAPLLKAKTSLDQGLGQLIDLANEKNGHDNITAVLVRLKLGPDMRPLSSPVRD